jgi:hypothetical protein
MRGAAITLARIIEQILWAAQFHNIEMNENEPLNDAVDELKCLANMLCNTELDDTGEKLNEMETKNAE